MFVFGIADTAIILTIKINSMVNINKHDFASK